MPSHLQVPLGPIAFTEQLFQVFEGLEASKYQLRLRLPSLLPVTPSRSFLNSGERLAEEGRALPQLPGWPVWVLGPSQ